MRLLRLALEPAEGGGPLPVQRAVIRAVMLQAVLHLLSLGTGVAGLTSTAVSVFAFALDGWMAALFVPALMSPRRQGLHDRAARTVVVWAGDAGARWLGAIAFVVLVFVVNMWLSVGPLRGL
jgi:uncharacterized RDD family membrane protein YckC